MPLILAYYNLVTSCICRLYPLCFSMKEDSNTCINTCIQGYLAPSQISYPAQRAIVFSYDNELNMPSSGMCETGLFQCRNALFPTALKSQWPLWNMTGIQMPLCLWTGPMFGGWAGEQAGARGHSGSFPKSTTDICRRGGGASPKCLEVNWRPAGLRALISNLLIN